MGFASSVLSKTKEVTEAAGKMMCDLADKTKLNLSIIDAESDMETLFKKLGKTTFLMADDPDNQELAEHTEKLLADIRAKKEQADELRARLLELKGVRVCECGHTSSVNSAFCCKCGAKLG